MLQINTVVQVLQSVNYEGDAPDARKQKSAFPPNFVHSIDSCHMMMTALGCRL